MARFLQLWLPQAVQIFSNDDATPFHLKHAFVIMMSKVIIMMTGMMMMMI